MNEETNASFSPEEEKIHQENKEKVKNSFGHLMNVLGKFVKNTLSLRQGIDKEGTMEGIRADVEFRGHAAWILICSILIASIGLSEGSAAVIIGAMLISPLMGPILGIGLAAGINDFDLFKKSMTNFGVAIVISLIISTLYFWLVPTPEINLEIQDRKQATLLSCVVALFGGAAGIIAGSRELKSNVVPGVAIATALMPPLCVVGFGIAHLDLDYILGAFYLFFINSVFIALPTYLYIKYLRFPVKEFVDPKREAKIKKYILCFLVVIMVPSVYIFYNVIQESFFYRDASAFITQVEETLEGTNTSITAQKVHYDKDSTSIKIILVGDPIRNEMKMEWDRLKDSNDLSGTDLILREPKDFSAAIEELKNENLNRSVNMNREFFEGLLDEKENELQKLNNRLKSIEDAQKDLQTYFEQVGDFYPELDEIGYANVISPRENGRFDSIPMLMIRWKEGVTEEVQLDLESRLKKTLVKRTNNANAKVTKFD